MKIAGKELPFPSDILDGHLANVAMNNIYEAIMITNKHNQIIYVNNKFEKTTGYSFTEMKGKTPKTIQAGIQQLSFYEKMKETVIKTGRWQGELWNRTKNGEIYLQSLSIVAIKDSNGNIENFIGIFKDLFHHKLDALDNLQNIDYRDSLTSLPKRIFFEKRIMSSIKIANETKSPFAIVFFQLHDFSSINERYGFLHGDIILKRMSTRLMNQMPTNSMLTRWNGTEFTCVFENSRNKTKLYEQVEKIHRIISTPLMVNGIEVILHASFGISIFGKDGGKVSDLLSKAYSAMVLAREDEKKILFYNEEIEHNSNVFIMELELKKAIKEEQFELYYQPFISVYTNELIGFEALIRWNHPTNGLISPVKFIPLAEQTGLIEEIGDLVFKKACNQQRQWADRGYTNVNISVNVSMNQFRNKYLVDNIKDILDETGVNPKSISIELTESSLIDDVEETILKLHELSKLGMDIAIDDFGTGYSSLGYLIDFPIQRLKIDRSFTSVFGKNKKVEAIVEAINTMAKTLNIEVVVEGVETEEQYKLVQKLECQVVQGYLFGKPLPKKEIETKWFLK